MADNLIKISELQLTNELKSADRIPIEQDGQTRSIKGAVLEQNLLNKTDARYIENTEKGQPGGVPTLDVSGKVPLTQLPEIENEVVTGLSGNVEFQGKGTEVDPLEGTVAIATTSKAGVVRSDGITVNVDTQGILSVVAGGKVEEGNTQAVSGGEVYSNIPNIELTNQPIKFYEDVGLVVSSNGNLGFENEGWMTMWGISVDGLDYIYIYNWNSLRTEYTFFNTPIPPQDNHPNPIIGSIKFGRISKVNGHASIDVPSGAKWMAITAKSNIESNDVYKNIVFLKKEQSKDPTLVERINGFEIKPYTPNIAKKNKLIKTDTETYILSGNFKQLIQVNRPINMPFDLGNLYLNNVLIGNRNDESAPYRIDGNTIGGNHLINGVTRNTNHKIKYLADGEEINFNTNFSLDFAELKVIESYDIMAVSNNDIISNTKLNYTFKSADLCIIDSNITDLNRNVALKDIMFLMNNKLNNSTYVVPNTVDFQIPKSVVSNEIITKNIQINADNPQNRVVNISNSTMFKIGFLPLGSNLNRDSNTERKRLEIRGNSGKIYMSTIDSNDISTMNIGDIYSAVGYKAYQENKGLNYFINTLEYNGKNYVIIDVFSNEKQQIKYDLPNGIQFKEFQNDYGNLYSLTNNVFEIYTDKASIILVSE